MARLDGYEGAATSRANFVVRDQLAFYDCFVASRFNNARDEFHWPIARRRAQELDGVLSGDSTRWLIGAALLHQVPRCRPVAVTIEERADDAAAQHSLKRFILLTRLPLRDNLVAIRKTADVKALRVRWPTAKTREIRGVGFLDTFHRSDDPCYPWLGFNHRLHGFLTDFTRI